MRAKKVWSSTRASLPQPLQLYIADEVDLIQHRYVAQGERAALSDPGLRVIENILCLLVETEYGRVHG